MIEPSADDDVPGCAVVVAVEAPTLSAEPSAGNANDPPPLEVGGAEIWLVDPPG